MSDLYFRDLHTHLSRLVHAALQAADAEAAVRRHLQLVDRELRVGANRYPLDKGRVFLIATGKAALQMSRAAIDILGSVLAGGTVITKRPSEIKDDRPRMYQAQVASGAAIQIYEAAHPVMDESSVAATQAVLQTVRQAGEGDVVLCLISGGTSALLTRPEVPVLLWQRLNQALLKSGCSIEEFNVVRRNLDSVKGGGLATAIAPAACASLILSDVVGNALPSIGSGPTVLSELSGDGPHEILERYDIAAEFTPPEWQAIMTALAQGRPARPAVPLPQNVIVGDVRLAAEAVAVAGEALGFAPRILTTHLQGEAREVGRVVAALAKDASEGECLILGGETTVTVRGGGLGGRNQELALSAAVELASWPRVAIASFATDGEDGPTDAAGAFVTGATVAEAGRMGLAARAFLDDNDSHTFFTRLEASGDAGLLRPGPTGTNINDLTLVLKYEE